jgi:succinate-acetate transporter protein
VNVTTSTPPRTKRPAALVPDGELAFDPPVQLATKPSPTPLTMADPGSWAILAFSTTSFMLGLYNAGVVNPAGARLVIPVALIFGGGVQVLVALLELIRGNLFAATVFGSFGPFWIIYGLIENTYAGKVVAAAAKAKSDPEKAVASGVTVFLAVFTVLTVIFLIGSLKKDIVLVSVLGLLVIALLALMLGVHGGHPGLVHTSGVLTCALAVLGWYRGAADVLADAYKRPVLPIGHLA